MGADDIADAMAIGNRDGDWDYSGCDGDWDHALWHNNGMGFTQMGLADG